MCLLDKKQGLKEQLLIFVLFFRAIVIIVTVIVTVAIINIAIIGIAIIIAAVVNIARTIVRVVIILTLLIYALSPKLVFLHYRSLPLHTPTTQ